MTEIEVRHQAATVALARLRANSEADLAAYKNKLDIAIWQAEDEVLAIEAEARAMQQAEDAGA